MLFQSVADIASSVFQKATKKNIAVALNVGLYEADWKNHPFNKFARLTDRAVVVPVEKGSDIKSPAILVDLTEPDDKQGTKLLVLIRLEHLTGLSPLSNSAVAGIDCMKIFIVETPAGESLGPEEFYKKIARADVDELESMQATRIRLLSDGKSVAQTTKKLDVLKRIKYVIDAIEAQRHLMEKNANAAWNAGRCLRLVRLIEKWEEAGAKESFPFLYFSNNLPSDAVIQEQCRTHRLQTKKTLADQALLILKKIESGAPIETFEIVNSQTRLGHRLVFADGETIDVNIKDVAEIMRMLPLIEINEMFYELPKQNGFRFFNHAEKPRALECIASVFCTNYNFAPAVFNGSTFRGTLTAFINQLHGRGLQLPAELSGVVDFHGHKIAWKVYNGLNFSDSPTFGMRVNVKLLSTSEPMDAFFDAITRGDNEKKNAIKSIFLNGLALDSLASLLPVKGSELFDKTTERMLGQLHWEPLELFVNSPQREEELQRAIAASVLVELNTTTTKPIAAKQPVEAKPKKNKGKPLTARTYNKLMVELYKCCKDIEITPYFSISDVFTKQFASGNIVLFATVRVDGDHKSFAVDINLNLKTTAPEMAGESQDIDVMGVPDPTKKRTPMKMAGRAIRSAEVAVENIISCFTEEDILDLKDQIRSTVLQMKEQLEIHNEETLEALRESYPVETMKFYLQQTASNGPGN